MSQSFKRLFDNEDPIINSDLFHPRLLDAQEWSVQDVFSISDQDALSSWNHLSLSSSVETIAPLKAQILKLYPGLLTDQIIGFPRLKNVIQSLASCLQPNQTILVITPCHPTIYQSIHQVIPADHIQQLDLNEKNGWELDLNELEKNLKPETRFIFFSIPSCPIGVFPHPDHLQSLIQLSRQKGIILISDEMGSLLQRKPGVVSFSMATSYENGISLNSMSHSFGMGGLGVHWIACANRDLAVSIHSFREQEDMSLSQPSQFIASLALQSKELILKCNNAVIAQNLQIAQEVINQHSRQIS